MTAVCENIFGKSLQSQKDFVCLSLPNRQKQQSDSHITADTAGFLGQIHFGVSDGLATFQESLASFVIYIQQIFVSTMPNRDKNLTATAQGASASTPTARKSVSKPVKVIPLRARRQISLLESSLKTECAAKNQAYSFILASGHLNDYVSFSKRTRGLDSHVLCQGVLVSDYVKSLITTAL